MDISTIKEAIGDEKFATLKSYIDDLTGQRDAARDESIKGRKALKAKAEALEADVNRMLEKLGIDSVEDIDSLPDGKGAGEAVKQLEARLKRTERERDDAVKGRTEVEKKYLDGRRSEAIAKAVAKHGFKDAETAAFLIERKARFEGDELMFEADGGKLISIDEAASWVAKSKPHLVGTQGGGGSGFREGAPPTGKNPWSKDTFNLTEQIQISAQDPNRAAALKAAATA